MAIFKVRTTVEWLGKVEADSLEEAERMGRNWETELSYGGIRAVAVEINEEDE